MELRNEEINTKKITTTYEVAKRKPEKIWAWWNLNPDLCNNSTGLSSAPALQRTGSNPGKPEFFSGYTVSFHNCTSCVFNRNDLLCICNSDYYQGYILGGPTTSQQSFPNLPRLTPSQHTPMTRCLLMNFTCMKKSAVISYNLHVGDRHIIEFICLEQNIIFHSSSFFSFFLSHPFHCLYWLKLFD